VGIEHAGFDATGYQWYNATEYLASAKLVAYLLKKYNITLDHAHIMGHGTVPAPGVQYEPNHVDPGPYWLWDYYFGLIHQQGVPYPPMLEVTGLPVRPGAPRIQLIILAPVMRRPPSDFAPLGTNGTETTANFSFAKLYTGPSTASPLIPHKGSTSDATNETFNIEPNMAYPVLATRPDAAGTGATMYEIWYGEEDRASNYYADASLAWVAMRQGELWIDAATAAHLRAPTDGGSSVPLIYGRPDVAANMSAEVIGQAPVGAALASEMTTTVPDPATGTTMLWLEVNFDHRQAWVPATEVVGH
jgi:hypothetical protein